MAVKYILSQLGKKMGLNPNDSLQRPVLLRFVNEAARELYMQADVAGSLMEMVFKVNGDQTVTLPYYVGFVRAVRELASMQTWHINQMRPRYNQFNWPDVFRNWRLKNRQALQTTVTNQSVGVLTVKAIETPNVIVSLTGSTADSSQITENVVMNATMVNSINNFLDYTSVVKNCVNQYDITLSDVDGKLLTTIPNTEIESQYQVIDVSNCPWLPQNTSSFDNYVEVLYKKTLPYLYNDGDTFPTPNCDDIIVNKCMQLWGEEQNKPDIALAYDTKATRTLARLQEENNRGTEDMVALVANPHDTLSPRIGTGMRRRYRYYNGNRY